MPFPTKIALGVVGVGVVGITALSLLGGGEDAPLPAVASAPVEQAAGADVPRGPLRSFARPDGQVLNVMGPTCYQDTRGNDVLLYPSEKAETDCFVLNQGGSDLLDLSRKPASAPVYVHVVGQPQSSQTIGLGSGPNVVVVEGGSTVRLTGSAGKDTVLFLPHLTMADIAFRQQGDDVRIETLTGDITLVGQTGAAEQGLVSHIMLRGGMVLERSQIRVQSIVGQGTPGNDSIRDTDADDVIYPGLGDDTITLLGGKNRVHYEGGNDRINSAGSPGSHNTLYIPFAQREAKLRPSEDRRDIIVEVPTGTVRLELQLFYPLDDPRAPIQAMVFTDGPVDAAFMRAAAEGYAGTTVSTEGEERARVRN